VVHTSLLVRAVETARIALAAAGRSWLPVRRSWRLNERQYGALTGMDRVRARERYGSERFHAWRRSYHAVPPPMPASELDALARDPRYADLAGRVPAAESLRDVTERLLPYWYDAVVPDLRDGRTVFLVGHGNSLRALIKHLDRVSDDDVTSLNVPTGVPLLYRLDPGTARPVASPRYLDPGAAARGIAEVIAQGAP
jgi:2,3-bisphosphoglycerate-dependent phosphoglycerate mutase